MSTEPAIRERAFFLYAISGSGSSVNAVAKQLREEFGTKTTAKTVREWAEEKDKDGLTWKEKRSRLVVRAEKRVEVIAEDRLVEIKKRTKRIADILYEKLISRDAPGLSTFDNAIHSFTKIADYELSIDKKYGGQLHPFEIVNVVLKVFHRCEPVSNVISEHWEKTIVLEIKDEIQALRNSKAVI
ncbi:hypothetical protein [Leptospira interrogans]|uniref:hypothetical protein n=1 Tax=Leptospira interrogans TaxID=173 RepID=UPI0002B973C8|nr:hypothetical protein [Leptospira interrogans]MCR8647688.1 hypothetical protein [Leptospira interrogans serovar Bataviae]OAM85446.1 hypothetical protein A1343_18040 [Leptospira interrogans serovar Bataviae]QOI36868.1 hypothetical protein Lepto1548_00185 [Leptospira interrogans serovar Bataviae]QOI38358.1 hypothetical protein Lepto1548_08750 [Leptospira interrogans serovar Bataviae]QYY60463.1 hypothetical protein GR153_000180 [Leptospira interrogans serovar Bataviae]